MRASPLFGLLLAACASPPEPPPAQPDAIPSTPRAPTLTADDRDCDAPGPRLRATDDGILLDDGTTPLRSLTVARGRHLRLARDQLYFFDPILPTLHTFDLEFRGMTRSVLELPPLEHPGFSSSDPLAFLQRQEDLGIAGDILCMDLHDRPADPTLTYNLRIDLATATVERRLVEDLTGDRCGAEREAVRPRLCTPAGPSTAASHDGLCVPVRLTAHAGKP